MRKKLRKMNVPKTILLLEKGIWRGYPGTRRGVRIIFSFQASPLRVLYV
jgi:hypothetical protein